MTKATSKKQAAFGDGGLVVVRFRREDWNNPLEIGFKELQ